MGSVMDSMPSIEPFRARFDFLEKEMADPNFYNNQRHAAEVGRERQYLAELLEAHSNYVRCEEGLHEAQEILQDGSADPELKEMAREEIANAEEKLPQLKFQLLGLMVPPDPADSRNTVMEIRAGTGGDEASLFAGDLYRMYVRYAELHQWKIEIMNSHPSECGGFKEIIFLISGENVYRQLKFESGVHRVQRIPTTEANGRIHTSAATVAVLPEAEEVDIQIAPEDLEITICRASGPGGQGVNTTDSAVQILHKPTGMIVSCADERSQQKNRVKALKVLRSRLLERKQAEEDAKYAADRKNQIGSGDRSERIRTYNFPQNRLTDHRIGLTVYNLPQVMEGQLEEIIGALQRANQEARIQTLFKEKA